MYTKVVAETDDLLRGVFLSQLTLRIKRVYFDLIKTGEKTYELRADTEFYRKRLSRDYDTLMLHYQRPERVYADIVSIRRVRTPKGISKDIIATDLCWKIELKNPRSEKL